MSKKKKKNQSEINTPAAPATGEKKKYPAWFYAAGFALPLIFILLLETGLRIFNYGNTYEVFSEVSPVYPGMLFLNPDITQKYFTNLSTPPGTIADGFYAVKRENTYRVFVLGESSTAGWPYAPNVSFPRYLRRKLQALYPDKTIEIVNLGVSAISSYVIRDFAKEAVKYEPDLVLIYTGHNEFYGALGAGSTQSLGANRTMINLALALQDYKTVQLIQNSIRTIWGLFGTSGEEESKDSGNETLMARMIGESLIPYDSDIYKRGLEQFRGNMSDILEYFGEKKIPVIFSTIASNLRDQKPFIPGDETSDESPGVHFAKASGFLQSGDSLAALQEYIKARDLDPLRFRASSDINLIIKELSQKYSVIFLDAADLMNKSAEYGITGKDLMTDHLHPNVKGYTFLGELFFNRMKEANLLPGELPANWRVAEIEENLKLEFPFTELDSVIADLRLRVLLGFYPFAPKGEPNKLVLEFKRKNLIDSLAAEVVDKLISWEDAHYRLAEYYVKKGDLLGAEREIRTLIAERPQNQTHYHQLAKMFIDAGLYDNAMRYLVALHKMAPQEFTFKWLGGIYLQQGLYPRALNYLSGALNYGQSDPQVWYNLAGAYYFNAKPMEAIEAVKRCLAINPNHVMARSLLAQLEDFVKKNPGFANPQK